MTLSSLTISKPFNLNNKLIPSTIKSLRISISSLNDKILTSNLIITKDIFDSLDDDRISITIDNNLITIESEKQVEEARKQQEIVISSNHLALMDSINVLFTSLNKEELSNNLLDLPDWLKETNGKVKKMTGTKLDLPLEIQGDIAESNSLIVDYNEENSKKKTKAVMRVVVGSQDGSIWLFSPPSSSNISNSLIKTTTTTKITTTTSTLENDYDRPSSTSPSFSSYNISTLPTPSSSSPGTPLESLPPPSPSSPSLSSSNSPPPSPTSGGNRSRFGKTSTATPHLRLRATSPSELSYPSSLSLNANGNGNGSNSHSSNLEAPHQPLRPRKASATVSVSVSNTAVVGGDDPSDLSSFNVSPSSPTFPTPATFLGLPSSSNSANSSNGGLGIGLPGRSSSKKNVQHKARKSSITIGIGLWENDSLSMSNEDLNHSPLLEEELLEDSLEVEDFSFESLVPIMKVIVGGQGAIVGLKILEGTRFGSNVEGSKAFISLRSSGMLSIHSFVDGRVLGSLNLSSKVSAARTGVVEFTGFEIIDTNSGKIAICYGKNNIGLLSIDLNSLEVLETVENIDSIAGFTSFTSSEGIASIAYIMSQNGVPHLMYRNLTSSTNSSTPESVIVVGSEVKSNSVRLGETLNAGMLPGISEQVRAVQKWGDKSITFDNDGILLFTIRSDAIVSLGFLGIEGVINICIENDKSIMVTTGKGQNQYRLESVETGDMYHFVPVRAFSVTDVDASTFITLSSTTSGYLLARSTATTRSLEGFILDSDSVESIDTDVEIKPFYEVTRLSNTSREQITTIVSIDTENAIVGLNSGAIYEAPYSNLYDSTISKTKVQLGGPISLLEIIEMGSRKVLVAGSSNGEAGAWYLPEWELIQIWKLFASPVTHLVQFKVKSTINSRLTNSLALISANSPIAIVSLFPPSLLFVIPGTKSSVESLSTNGEDLMIVYKHGLARVWDVEAQELRRSMDLKTALGVLGEKGWKTWFSLNDRLAFEKNPTSPYNPAISLDLRSTIDTASKSLPWSDTRRSKKEVSEESCDIKADTINSRSHLSLVKYLLSNVLTFDLDKECDSVLKEHLQVEKPKESCSSAVLSASSCCIPITTNPWAVSAVATAQRLLHIICLLRVFLNFPDTERYASEVILFYSSFLSDAVGSSFIAPALDVFADYWLDVSTEVQQAARLLFGTYLISSSNGYMLSLVERWQELLPSRQVESSYCESADQAVLVIGLLASEKFKLLSTATLKDVSVSILSYLEKDDHPYHQAIATELCIRGFEIWQNYVDAMKLVRLLFGLATGRNANTPLEVRNLAKLATLHIAVVNTPLFMTTLSFDILNSESALHRKATLKLLGFMVRKKPLVLYTSLPKLAEAVVKSLDPSVTSLRETVHEAATVILNELVRTYPSIDFHHSSQRLAVGTPEGATIIYDLRTGTRLYVLEGHTKSITALSWSPDGRRLVSVSLEESKVLVWKIGVGLLSMFAGGLGVGGEGRGAEGKVPWKVLDFNVGDEGLMTTAATLEWVTFEWPADRTTRLRIRESNLTFSV